MFEPKTTDPDFMESKRIELRKSQAFATGILVAMAVVFVLALHFEARWPWLFYVRSFAEAAMVGACADWFAVVALFRRPLGLPIPHTAIVPVNKDRIADSIGAFICNNFLDPEVVAVRLKSIDAASALSVWIRDDGHVKMASSRLIHFLDQFFLLLDREEFRRLVLGAINRSLKWIPTAPLVADALSILLANGQLVLLAERAIAFGDDALVRNRDFFQAKVTEHSSKWIPRWIDVKLADRVLSGMHTTLIEMREADHPWREWFQDATRDFVRRLKSDPELAVRVEEVKRDLLSKPGVEAHLERLLHDLQQRLQQAFAPGNDVAQAEIEHAFVHLGRWLDGDMEVRAMINAYTHRAIEAVVVPHREEIGAYIAEVVKQWDTETLVSKLELTVGRDLQFIRINGTIVGGLVGLAIAALTKLLGGLN